jgi:hypothetical protein
MYNYNLEIRYENKKLIKKNVLAITKRVRELIKYKQKLIERWQKIANIQVKYYNRKHIALNFKTENLIMLFIKNIKLKKSSQKFSLKLIKLFRIIELIHKQTYRLILFSCYRIHDVFYVFYLKSYKRRKNNNIISKFSFSEFVNNENIDEVKKILKKKISQNIIYYLIKWKNWSEKYNEWVTKKDMNAFDLIRNFEKRSKKRRKIK